MNMTELREAFAAWPDDYRYPGSEAETILMLVANSSPRTPVANTLVELLGEWPVGHRGEKGWEKLEGES